MVNFNINHGMRMESIGIPRYPLGSERKSDSSVG